MIHPPTVPGYPTTPAQLTDLGALAAALEHRGVLDPGTGAPFTETRLFGLSGGPGFMAFIFQYKGVTPLLTFTCRSSSLPGPLIGRALSNAGIGSIFHETGSAKKAASTLDAELDQFGLAHIAVDQAQLPWLGQGPEWHGQWQRYVNVASRTDDQVVIADLALWTLGVDELAAARAGVKRAKHRLISMEGRATLDARSATQAALRAYVLNQEEAPFKGFQSNFGLRGLARTAERMADSTTQDGWARVFSSGPHVYRALWRTVECLTFELTAPAGGRLMFADFLDNAGLSQPAVRARRSAKAFRALCGAAVRAGGDSMTQAMEITQAIDTAVRSGLPNTGLRVVELRRQRDALADTCDVDEAARRRIFASLGAHMATIYKAERALVDAIKSDSRYSG